MNDTPRNVPLLFTPIKLRSVVARNRIMCSPMCQYVSDDGGPGEWQLVNFGRFAMGGSGIIFGEETAVEARGRKTHHCAGINDHLHARNKLRTQIKKHACNTNHSQHQVQRGMNGIRNSDRAKGEKD